MGKFIKWIAVIKKKLHDPYSPKNYAWMSFLVPPPTPELPYACALVTISTGKSKIMIRFNSVAALKSVFTLTADEESRLVIAFNRANFNADKIEEDMRILFQKRHLRDGAQWIQTDTGEVIAQAERIQQEHG
jgi:hypothetical protein